MKLDYRLDLGFPTPCGDWGGAGQGRALGVPAPLVGFVPAGLLAVTMLVVLPCEALDVLEVALVAGLASCGVLGPGGVIALLGWVPAFVVVLVVEAVLVVPAPPLASGSHGSALFGICGFVFCGVGVAVCADGVAAWGAGEAVCAGGVAVCDVDDWVGGVAVCRLEILLLALADVAAMQSSRVEQRNGLVSLFIETSDLVLVSMPVSEVRRPIYIRWTR